MREQLRLPDGRRIDYREFGERGGVPAVYLHGTPSSASEGRWLDAAARDAGVQIVALDRPGYLGSDAHVPASPLGVAEDVIACADALEFERFAVVGFSGGAGYALSPGYVAPARVTVVHVGGGLVSLAGADGAAMPLHKRLPFLLVSRAPGVARPVLGGGFRVFRRAIEKRLGSPVEAAEWFFRGPAQGAQIDAVARYVRTTAPEVLRADLEDHARATSSTQAVIDDVTAYSRPWPFPLADLEVPVEIWHGSEDPAVPIAFAERAAAQIPRSTLHAFDGEGHFVFHTHSGEIARSIVRSAGAVAEEARC